MNVNNSEFLNESAAAEFLGVAPGTLAVWRCTGRYRLPYVKVGRLVRYRLEDLKSWATSQRRTAVSDDSGEFKTAGARHARS